ncbi:MAG: AMIN domain-containing protein, partial [Gammaproteobacteria bacterium]|nr:AMIN domain-containing protein [Gammaproteobacteria bacterium]
MPNVAFRRRQKIRVAKTLLVLVGLLFFQSAFAKPNQVSDIRVWMAPDHTRIVFDLQGPAEYRVFSLEQPNRLVVDLENVVLKSTRLPVIKESSSVKGMRYAIRNKNDLRIVLDLDAIPKKIKHFKLEPNREYGHRVLVELLGEEETIQEIVVPPPKTNGQAAAQQEQQQRDIVVAIDAGHGGEDPGARGKKGTKEKEVVLSIAKKLADRVNKQEGMKAVLVRGGDYYISLRKRI